MSRSDLAGRPSLMDRARQVASKVGLDMHVVSTLLFRGWSVIAGAAMLILLPLWLGPVQLGYYYTFASVLALQIFFELGMNQVVTQITSHEIAHLTIHPDGSLEGAAIRIDKLAALAKLLRRWYLIAATLFACVVGLAGTVFFSRHQNLPLSSWLGPWVAITLASAVNLYLSPSLAMLEGAGRIGEVARLRLWQSMAGYGLMAVALFAGTGLWAAPVVAAVAALGTGLWLGRSGRFIRTLRDRTVLSDARIDWRKEIFPFQWRIALSWISGYFIFQLFTPMVFENQGAVQAGRFGMVLAIFNALQSIGMSWVYSKGPQMAASISRGERKSLNVLFLSVLRPSIGFTVLSSALIVGGACVATHEGWHFLQRISSIEVLIYMALVTIVNSMIFAFAVYMRAHKEEPMMAPSLVLAVLVLAVAHWASRVSVERTAALYFWVTLLVALPWTLALFRKYWRRA